MLHHYLAETLLCELRQDIDYRLNNYKERFAYIWHKYLKEIVQFLTVGGLAFVVNASVTWGLMHSVMSDSHVKAKIVAGIVATIFSWIMNRLWTFRSKRTENVWREAREFAAVNILGLAIEAGCVFFSRYVLNLDSPTASFISGTIIGTILGTIVRYFLYRFWVFGQSKQVQDGETREEAIAHLMEEATSVMTGKIPVVKPEQVKPHTEIREEN